VFSLFSNRRITRVFQINLSVALTLVGLIGVGVLFTSLPARAAAGINPQVNFQGRLLNAAGAVVPDGAYNLEFKLYTGGTGCVSSGSSPCGGTNVWTEDWVYGSGAPDNRVIVRNGYFSVSLGALSSLTSIDFNNDTLWTSINIGNTTTAASFGVASGDGEMLPFKRLTSSPYAFNAGKLGGLAAGGFIQNVAPNATQQQANINILSVAGTSVAAAEIQTVASATAPVLILKGGATPGVGADLLQLQNSAAAVLFRVDSAGVIGSANVSAGATNSAGTTLRTGNSTTSGNTGDLTISTGTATSGNSGNITIGTGSATGTPGSVIVKNAGDSASAFQVQTAGGGNLLNIGTSNNQIDIGTSSTPLINDNLTTNAPTGSLIGSASWSSGSYVQLNSGGFTNGEVEYTPALVSQNFDANFQFNTTGGADATYLYAFDTSTPNNEGYAGGGYHASFNEYNGSINLFYNGSSLASYSVATIGNATWHNVEVVKSGTNIKIYYDSSLVINYTDITRTLTGIKLGLGGRSGSVSGTHRVRNFTVATGSGVLVGNVNLKLHGTQLIQPAADSATAFQVQNAAGNQVLTVDTSGNAVVLGKASGLTGQLAFANSAGANLVTLQAGASSAAYALTLPTVAPTTGQCLQSGSVTAGLMVFATCGLGSANTALSNLAAVAINTSLLPGVTNSIDLGSAALTVRSGYFGTSVITPVIDTASTVALNVGSTASAINLNTNVVVAAGQSLTLVGSGTRPSSPTDGMLYYDTTLHTLLQYNSNTAKWQADRSSSTKIVGMGSPAGCTGSMPTPSSNPDGADFVVNSCTSAQTVISAAIAALPATGGSIYLMEGTYIVDAGITIPNNVSISGAGAATIIKLKTTTNTSFQLLTNSDTTTGTRVNIKNLQIDGNKAGNVGFFDIGIMFSGMGSATRDGGMIANVIISNMNSCGIYLLNSSKNTVSGNTSSVNAICGIEMSGSSYNTITGNTVQGNTTDGIVATTTSNTNTITGNVSAGNISNGIIIASSAYNVVTGNTTQSNTLAGMVIVSSSNGNTVSGNVSQGNGTVGIAVTSTSPSNTINGNTVQGNVTGVQIGSPNNTVTGNTVSGNTAKGIYLNSASNITVGSNNIYDNGGSTTNNGIYIDVTSNSNTITGNDITDSSCTTNCYAINIQAGTANYLANNLFSSTPGTATINDAGTGTVYANQSIAENGAKLVTRTANDPAAFQIQNAAGTGVLTVDTTNSQLAVRGNAAANAAVIGSELFTGSYSFAVASGWTAISGTAQTATATHTAAGGTTAISPTPAMTIVAGNFYQVVFNVTTSPAGSVTPGIGGSSGQPIAGNSTNQTQMILATTTGNLTFTPTTDFSGTITNVSVKLVTTTGFPPLVVKDSSGASAFDIRIGLATSRNTFLGLQAGQSITTGVSNTATGSLSMVSTSTGGSNTANGAFSLQYNTTGDQNTAVGRSALQGNTTGGYNAAVGAYALQGNTTGFENAAFGVQALLVNTSGFDNTASGTYSLSSNTTGYENSALGIVALNSNTTGYDNTASGAYALYSNTTGIFNTASGAYALQNNTTGNYNTAQGYQALLNNTTGSYNTSQGYQSLINNTTGWYNSGTGINTLLSNTTGSQNTAYGISSLYSNTTGTQNTASGNGALYSNITGSNNSGLGYNAGYQDSSAHFNTGAALQNATVIGAFAQAQVSNSIILGSVDTATKVGIGTTVPSNTFSVSPLDYQFCTATRTNSSTALLGTSSGCTTVWTAGMIGDIIVFADGTTNTVNAFTDATHITMGTTFAGTTDASPVYYRFHHVGLQVTSAGNTYIQNSSATAFQVQNSAGTSIFSVDTTGAGSLSVAAVAAPTSNQVSITNAGQAVATANANGLKVNYVGGAAAVEAAGIRVDFQPGSTSGGTWNGLHIVANATGAVSGVTENGIKLVGPTSPGTGTETAVNITTGWDIGVAITSGGIQMSGQTDPTAPASNSLSDAKATGNVQMYAQSVDGRMFIKTIGPNDSSYALQTALFNHQVCLLGGTGSLTTTQTGSCAASALNAGTAVTPTEATGLNNRFLSNTANSNETASAGLTSNSFGYFRGSTSGQNGIFYNARIYLPDASYATNTRFFIGLADSAFGNVANATSPLASDDPTNNRVGFSWSTVRGDTNFQFATKDNTTQNLANTAMALTAQHVYEFYIYTPQQGTTIYWRVDDLTASTIHSGSVTANLPSGSAALRPGAAVTNTASGTAHNLDINHIYVESGSW